MVNDLDKGSVSAMPEAVFSIAAVLLAAGAGAYFQHRRDKRKRRERLVRHFLAQLQDACESLWFRLRNLAYESADVVTTAMYLQTTTMYTLGRALAIERMLALEALYPEIQDCFSELGSTLKPRVIDNAVADTVPDVVRFHQYDRIALAEAAFGRGEEGFRQGTFLEFWSLLTSEEYDPELWASARGAVAALKDKGDLAKPLMDTVKDLALSLSLATDTASPLVDEDVPVKHLPK